MRILYSILYSVAFFISLPYFIIAGLLKKKYLSSALQRFGFIPVKSTAPSLWIHSVSVGEFLAAKPLIQAIQEAFPELPLFISTTTVTGQTLAGKALPGKSFYFPFDWTWCIRRVIAGIKPRLILVMETEIWPNFLWETANQSVPVILVNGRISDRSYNRYKLFRSILPRFRECLVQTEEDARRIQSLGLSSGSVEVMGNLKFDFRPSKLAEPVRKFLSDWKGSSLLWIAGSTMSGEEEPILEAFAEFSQRIDMKLMIAPRHPERFQEVEDLVRHRGFQVVRRSRNHAEKENVMILDSIGELASAYEIATLVFIGGTLTYGGHNPIEAAYYGKPIISGPHYENVRGIFEPFLKRDAIHITQDLTRSVGELIGNDALMQKLGSAARDLVRENEGAVAFVLQHIGKWIDDRKYLEPGAKSIVR